MLFCLEEALFEFRDSELFGQIFWAAFQWTHEQTLLTSGVWQTNALNTSPQPRFWTEQKADVLTFEECSWFVQVLLVTL